MATFERKVSASVLDDLHTTQAQLAELRGRVDSVLTRYQNLRVFRNPHTAQVARGIQEEIGALAAADSSLQSREGG